MYHIYRGIPSALAEQENMIHSVVTISTDFLLSKYLLMGECRLPQMSLLICLIIVQLVFPFLISNDSNLEIFLIISSIFMSQNYLSSEMLFLETGDSISTSVSECDQVSW